MVSPTLPFGRHRGEPLDTVPSGYLRWLLQECRSLSSGLRSAVAGELQARGVSPVCWSGKEVLLPAPPPLRTGQAPFDTSGSSRKQRACESTR
jgi:hypothetical protein